MPQKEPKAAQPRLSFSYLLCFAALILCIAAAAVWAMLAPSASTSAYLSHPETADSADGSAADESLPVSSEAEAPASSEFAPSETLVSSAPAVDETYHAVPLIDAVHPVAKRAAVDDSYFADAVFIGDSRTEGFMLYSGLSGTTAYTSRGMAVNKLDKDPVAVAGGGTKTVYAALQSKPDFNKVYIMLGVNELGWVSKQAFVEDYAKIIDKIRSIRPGVTIYIQSILPVTANKSKADKIYNNQNIEQSNALIQQMTVDKQVHYLNVSEALVDADGYLPDGSTFDGVHLNAESCRRWLQYLRTHTVS